MSSPAQQKGRHREVDDVQVAQGHLAHEPGPALVAQRKKNAGAIRTSNTQCSTVMRSTLLSGAAKSSPLERHAIVVGAG